MDLQDHVVIVTGSSSGIGQAIARRLACHGARVVVNSANSAAAGRSIAAELPDACYVQGDISDPSTAAALVDAALGRWGRLDGLVNNAAVTVDGAAVAEPGTGSASPSSTWNRDGHVAARAARP